jgi:F0F1-type ATP synthase membrane subunit b/b'
MQKIKNKQTQVGLDIDNSEKLVDEAQNSYNAALERKNETDKYCQALIDQAQAEALRIVQKAKFETDLYYEHSIRDAKHKAELIQKVANKDLSSKIVQRSFEIVRDYLMKNDIEHINLEQLETLCSKISKDVKDNTN